MQSLFSSVVLQSHQNKFIDTMHVRECTFILIWIQGDTATAVVYMINNNEVHNSYEIVSLKFFSYTDSRLCCLSRLGSHLLHTTLAPWRLVELKSVHLATGKLSETIREDVRVFILKQQYTAKIVRIQSLWLWWSWVE